MRMFVRTVCSIGLVVACAGSSMGQAAFIDGVSAAPGRNADKQQVFRPWSERVNLVLRNVPAVVLPAFDLAPLLAEDQMRFQNGDRTLRNGIVLPLEVGEVFGSWSDDGAGGMLWSVDVGSTDAIGLRIRLTKMNIPKGATVSVQSMANPDLVSGPFTGQGDLATGEAWSQSLPGGVARVEYHLPVEVLEVLKGQGVDIENPGLPFEVADLVHMYVEPGANADRGETEPCHVDINCVSGWEDAKSGTARINYVRDGGSFLCTGLLMNNLQPDFAPYFMTANHCLNTQASATSAEIVWNWWKNGCNGANPNYFNLPRSRVATLLSTGAASDYTFLMIEGSLAAGRFWNGWDSGNIPNGSAGAAVHHPGGGVMRYSSGTANYTLVCSANSHFRTNYNVAPTEPGSSGSGWYDTAGRFRGQLHCGFSFCGAALDDGDDWGHFSVTYPNIAGLLNGSSDDSTENNDSCASAWVIGPGNLFDRVLRLTDADWFGVDVAAGQRIIVTVSFEHDYGDIDVNLFDSCGGNIVASGTGTSDSEVLDWSNYGAATRVRINPFLYQGSTYADTRNNYSINVQLLDAPPSNDTCLNARVISAVPYTNFEDNSNASSDGPPGSCNSASATVMQNAIWYRWTAPASGTATFSAAHGYDGIVAVYTGSCFGLAQVACGDALQVGETDSASFNAVEGTTYYLAAGDWGLAAGGGPTTISLTFRYDNEDCAGAREITSLPFVTTQNTALASADGPAAACDGCGASVMQNDVWYRWTATESCIATVTLDEAGSYDSVMNIWSGSCGTLSNVACFDEPQPFSYSFVTIPGETYHFQFGDYCISPGGGPTTFTLNCRALNDDCAGAQQIACNSRVVADLTKGTTDPNDPVYSCRFFGPGQGFNSLWYTFVAQTSSARLTTGPVTGGAVDDTLLAVYSGTCGSLVELACNDDANGTLFSQLTVGGLNVGETYYVQIAAWLPDEVGVYSLILECPPDCAACPSGGIPEAEICGEGTNEGCNVSPSVYEPIACSTTICGRTYYDGTTRDTDFYSFTLTEPATVQWCVRGQGAMQAAILPIDNCFDLFSNAFAEPCEEACATAVLPAGTFVVFAAHDFFGGAASIHDCDQIGVYTGSLSVTPACPSDANGDFNVSFPDIARILRDWGNTGTCGGADVNGDGIVSFPDIAQVLRDWGTTCIARDAQSGFTPAVPADDVTLFGSTLLAK